MERDRREIEREEKADERGRAPEREKRRLVQKPLKQEASTLNATSPTAPDQSFSVILYCAVFIRGNIEQKEKPSLPRCFGRIVCVTADGSFVSRCETVTQSDLPVGWLAD